MNNWIYNRRARPFSETENVPESDTTINILSKVAEYLQSLKGQPTADPHTNVLLRPPATETVSPTITQPGDIYRFPRTPASSVTTSPSPTNWPYGPYGPSREPSPEAKKPVNSLLDYWSRPIIGKMPLDQFVQIAGALGSAFAPETPMGRAGAVMSQIGGQAYGERMKREYEEPENILRRRWYEAKIAEAGKKEVPTEWGAFSTSLRGTIDPDTGKTYTEGKILQQYHALTRAPKEEKAPSPYYEDTIQEVNGVKMYGKYDVTSEEFIPIRKATAKDIEKVETGKLEEAKAPIWKKNISTIGGIPHERMEEWSPETKTWIPKSDWVRTERPERPRGIEGKPEYTQKQAMARVAAINKAIAGLKSEGVADPETLRQFPWVAGISKRQDPEAVKQAIVSLEAERDEVIQYAPEAYRKKVAPPVSEGGFKFKLPPGTTKGAPGARVGIVEKVGDIIERTGKAIGLGGRVAAPTPKVVAPSSARVLPQGIPKGSVLLERKSKRGNPVYKAPNGKLYEASP